MKPVILISGAPPGESGAGQFLAYLKDRGARLISAPKLKEPATHLLREFRVFLLFREIFLYFIGKVVFYARLKRLQGKDTGTAVLFHPQFIGMKRTIHFIQNNDSDIYLYLLDNSFFCIRSYNHLPGTYQPCLECLGGQLQASREHRCQPFPIRSTYARDYVLELLKLVRKGRVKLLAQCVTQAKLAEKHFGVHVSVSGLWAKDWNDVFDQPGILQHSTVKWDVVYHGYGQDAKGVSWLMEVAAYCPELSFLFPFPKSWLISKPQRYPPNCTFRYIKWETGLQEEIASARIVAVPSLWSAPIEGALVKSIVKARAVAIVDSETGFSNEIPDNLLLKLPQDINNAAAMLMDAIKDEWQPDSDVKGKWIENFENKNRNSYEIFMGIVNERSTE